ncbi:MAG: helix-turn-helix domain-containing protein [Comamonas sp.]|jgi:DNA-binding transcriptional regulator YdaS (Cro superfamily)|nr:helix-turn-helix domain-containing protein [Comamonas sp.]
MKNEATENSACTEIRGADALARVLKKHPAENSPWTTRRRSISAAYAGSLEKIITVTRQKLFPELYAQVGPELQWPSVSAFPGLACEAGTAQDHEYAAPGAQKHGGSLKLSDNQSAKTSSSAVKVSKLSLETSRATIAVIHAVRDGDLSDSERALIERQFVETVEALRRLRQMARAFNVANRSVGKVRASQ